MISDACLKLAIFHKKWLHKIIIARESDIHQASLKTCPYIDILF